MLKKNLTMFTVREQTKLVFAKYEEKSLLGKCVLRGVRHLHFIENVVRKVLTLWYFVYFVYFVKSV